MVDIAAFLTAALVAARLLWQVALGPFGRRRRREAERPGYIDLRPRY